MKQLASNVACCDARAGVMWRTSPPAKLRSASASQLSQLLIDRKYDLCEPRALIWILREASLCQRLQLHRCGELPSGLKQSLALIVTQRDHKNGSD